MALLGVNDVMALETYEVNEADANARFTGKRIRVVGGFQDAQMENGRMMLHFVQGSDAYANYSLTCIMAPSQQAQVAALQRPQRIVVEGVSLRRTELSKVTMDKCVIVSR